MGSRTPRRWLPRCIGIPGVTVIEARATADTLDLLVETEVVRASLPAMWWVRPNAWEPNSRIWCPLSVGGKVSRLTWRRRRWRCVADGCPLEDFGEDDPGIDAFNERIAAANARFPLETVFSAPSAWRDRLEE